MPNNKNNTFRQWVLYWVDRILRSSFSVQIVSLVIFTLFVTTLGMVMARLAGIEGSTGDLFWWTWLRVTDPGYLGEDKGFSVRLIATIIVVSGWIVFGLLISIISTAIQQRLAALRRGANFVYGKDFTVVLGWNSTIYSLIDQLSCSDEESEPGDVIIVAHIEKEIMEAKLAKHCLWANPRQIICRKGRIESAFDLAPVLGSASQIIILGNNGFSDKTEIKSGLTAPELGLDSELKSESETDLQQEAFAEHSEAENDAFSDDSCIFKCILACRQVLEKNRPLKKPITIIAAIKSEYTRRIVEAFYPDNDQDIRLMLVNTGDILTSIIAQCAWQPLLAPVYQDLLSYSGGKEVDSNIAEDGEIYCVAAEDLAIPPGTTFGECGIMFDNAILVGFIRDGEVHLIPSPETIISPQDVLSFIAACHQNIRLSRSVRNLESTSNPAFASDPNHAAVPTSLEHSAVPRRILLLGSGSQAATVLQKILGYLPKDSLVYTTQSSQGLVVPNGITIKHLRHRGIKWILDRKFDFSQIDTAVIIDEHTDAETHDTIILTIMAAIRAVTRDQQKRLALVAEFIDPRNRALAKTVNVYSTIISPELISNYMVQLAKNPARRVIYSDLLDPLGSSLFVNSISQYCPNPTQEISFNEIAATAVDQNELAIGYIEKNGAELRTVLCPREKDAKLPSSMFHKIVVVGKHRE